MTEDPNSGSGTLNISTGSGGTGTVLQSAQDAVFTLDNISYDQASNNNTIQGMNVTLLNTGTTNLTLSTSYQTSSIVTAAQNLVNSYNQIITLAQQSQLQSGGIDANINLLLSSLQDQMNSTFGGTGTYAGQLLSAIGIEPSQTPKTVQVTLVNGQGTATAYITGLLQLDTSSDPADLSSLTNALNNNLSAVQSMLFDSTNGILTLMGQNVLNPGTGSADKAINDPANGGLVTVNSQLASVTQQLTDTENNMNEMISGLVLKYAQLEVTLQAMQDTSDYLYQVTQLSSSNS
jgi:flagellar hook-associated protein 2